MNNAEYRIWKRRLPVSGYLASEAILARLDRDEVLAQELLARAERILIAAYEIQRREKGQWVLVVPQTLGHPSAAPMYCSQGDYTGDVNAADKHATYTVAMTAREGLKTGELYLPEPLDYHQRLQEERQGCLAEPR
jgi:hypothetical protein